MKINQKEILNDSYLNKSAMARFFGIGRVIFNRHGVPKNTPRNKREELLLLIIREAENLLNIRLSEVKK